MITKVRLVLAYSPQKISLLIFIFLSSIGLLVQIFHYINDIPRESSSSCLSKKEAILQKLEGANHCIKDSDCIIASYHCPFGCRYVHRSFDSRMIVQEIETYEKECGFCIEECTIPPASCINNRCQSSISLPSR